MEYLLLILGFVILLSSGNYLVKSSVTIAYYLKLSTLVVGVTVVSFGTSAPELLVSLQAAVDGHSDISIGNIVGSNISNIALVLALTALIFPIPVKSDTIRIDWPVMMTASVLFYLFALNLELVRLEGLLFVVLLISYIYFLIYRSRKQPDIASVEEGLHKPLWMTLVILVISAVGLVVGSRLLVDNAIIVARDFGVSERVISVTLIAFGTSVPELATSAVAAFKKEMDISIGNIIGSNTFNLFAVLGITSLVKPIDINPNTLSFDIFWMLGFSILLFLFILPAKAGRLTRIKGGILFTLYISYVLLLFIK
ncbi:MAG: calcium/sodium antiporter [Bacteroidetes bacterium]|jgi:cation:H+ antiporter|nr:calcium/sodium antiporter [Bacteroidota bacterium]